MPTESDSLASMNTERRSGLFWQVQAKPSTWIAGPDFAVRIAPLDRHFLSAPVAFAVSCITPAIECRWLD
jgi:hypothetical protein